MSDPLHFRISAALKDIIGRDLITDDNIAVFELVKNSYDAYATQVDIYFENIYTKNPKIIIKDNGKGMDFMDLKNKWLFVGYSAKKEGTEDDSLDYRDNIYTKRPFAGAKGIGRFSCDRLGKSLYLETKKKTKSNVEILNVDWEEFEKNIRQEFVDIQIFHLKKKKGNYNLVNGTVIEISNLRNDWDREKLLRLKDSLAKLINPSRQKNQKFKIFIHVLEEKENDDGKKGYKKKINGEVKNFLFEELELKTTKIEGVVSDNGKNIISTLIDGGTQIYKITEENKFNLLKGITFTIFYLNRAAKMTFAKKMGLASKKYGHIFLYKNGFRIYPFGEPYEDPLKIDVRKSRKKYSTLGTGEIIGQIEILGNNPELKETSSRGDGLVQNKQYDQLSNIFFLFLERLEKYVVDVQQWGLSIEDENVNRDLKSRITDLIASLTGAEKILKFEYSENFLDILEKGQTDSASKILSNLTKLGIATKNSKLIKDSKKLASRLSSIQKAKDIAEQATKQIGAKLQDTVTENLFLKSVKGQDFDEVISFLHHIGIASSMIDNYLVGLYKLTEIDLSKINSQEAKKILRLLIFENKKILNISKFATKANFKIYTDAIELNLDEYIKEYVNNIVTGSTGKQIKIWFVNSNKKELVKKFRPIEVNILIDNLLSNSKKAGASNFWITIKRDTENRYQIEFRDDGMGINVQLLDKIFNFGYTTTKGSGIGLYHIKEIVNRLNGEISVQSKIKKGTIFTITLMQ